LNQTAVYLGDRMGHFGFICTRQAVNEERLRKLHSIYNDSQPHKIILVLSDADLNHMLDMRCRGLDPMRHVQERYTEFLQRVQ
jgi:hypothetical protein